MRGMFLLGLIVTIGLAVWGGPQGAPWAPDATRAPQPRPSDTPAGPRGDPAAESPAGEPSGEGTRVRQVTPPGFTPPPDVQGPLERIAIPGADAPAPEPEADVLLRVVVVEDATTLRAGKIVVRFVGVAGPDSDARCRPATGGEERPCAVLATAALRAMVGRRAVSCRLPKAAKEGEFRTACRLGKTDLAEWLARHGWAIAVADAPEPVATAAVGAREKRAGMWAAEGR